MKKTGLILITGFLGAGKTTFLTGFLRRFRGKRLYVIVNEFGKTGIDGTLLTGRGAAVSEIDGGSVFCTCRLDQFEQALSDALASEPDRILVEASGLSDPTAIRRITDRFPDIAYSGCIALADAPRVAKVLETSRMAARQLAVASVILLNKTDLVDREQAEALQKMLEARFPGAKVHETQQGAFTDEWLQDLKPSVPDGEPAGGHARDITLQKANITVRSAMTSPQLRQFLALFAEDTYRVKGLVRLADGAFLVDGIGGAVEIRPYDGPLPVTHHHITALAGAGAALLQSIQRAREWYPDLIENLE